MENFFFCAVIAQQRQAYAKKFEENKSAMPISSI